tara:strand:- start:1259 stop:1663 length:405 start_codon:yes stop_codon:yes gene_type:complete
MKTDDFNHIKWHTKLITGQLFGISENKQGQKTLYVMPISRDNKFNLNEISEIDLSRSNLDELSPSELDEINKAFGTRFGQCYEYVARTSLFLETRDVIKKLEDTISINFAILDETIEETNTHLEKIARGMNDIR